MSGSSQAMKNGRAPNAASRPATRHESREPSGRSRPPRSSASPRRRAMPLDVAGLAAPRHQRVAGRRVGQQPAAHRIAQRLVLVRHAEDLEVGAAERDDAVVRAPAGVPPAGQRGEPVALPEPARDRLDVARADDRVIDAHAVLGAVLADRRQGRPDLDDVVLLHEQRPEHARDRRRHLGVDLVGLDEADRRRRPRRARPPA